MTSLKKSNDKSSPSQRYRSNPISTPQFAYNPSQQLDIKQLFSQSYSVIKQQQAYINKLEKDNDRKDALIANLLNRKQNIKTKRNEINNIQNNNIQMEKIIVALGQLKQQNQSISRKCQRYHFQLQNKCAENKQLMKQLHKKQQYQKQLQNKIQQHRQASNRIKQAYEAKIAKLLSQMRKQVYSNILRSKQKIMLTQQKQNQTVGQNRKMVEIMQGRLHMQKNMSQTPVKNYQQLKYQNPQKYQTPSNQNFLSPFHQPLSKQKNTTANTNTTNTQSKKKPQNTPYKLCNNFIVSEYKNFPSNNFISLDVPDSFRQDYSRDRTSNENGKSVEKDKGRKKKQKYSKMLGSVQDVQFMTDNYYSDSYDNSNEESSSSNYSQRRQNRQQPKKQQKISIQKVIQQFHKYQKSQASLQSPLTQQQGQPYTAQPTSQTKKSNNKKSITVILQKLSQKIKYFQSDSLQSQL